MTVTGHIKPWEWSRAKRWFLEGYSYTEIAKRSGRSRSVIAVHGAKHRWQQQRETIRAIRQSAGIVQSLRYLESAETVLLEYIERLNTAKALERVQRVKSDLEQKSHCQY
jgi:transposase